MSHKSPLTVYSPLQHLIQPSISLQKPNSYQLPWPPLLKYASDCPTRSTPFRLNRFSSSEPITPDVAYPYDTSVRRALVLRMGHEGTRRKLPRSLLRSASFSVFVSIFFFFCGVSPRSYTDNERIFGEMCGRSIDSYGSVHSSTHRVVILARPANTRLYPIQQNPSLSSRPSLHTHHAHTNPPSSLLLLQSIPLLLPRHPLGPSLPRHRQPPASPLSNPPHTPPSPPFQYKTQPKSQQPPTAEHDRARDPRV